MMKTDQTLIGSLNNVVVTCTRFLLLQEILSGILCRNDGGHYHSAIVCPCRSEVYTESPVKSAYDVTAVERRIPFLM